MFSSKIIISSRIVVIFWLLDYFSLWEIRRLVLFCPCYWHTLRLGRLWSKSFIGLQLVVIRLMYPAGWESYQKFAVVLLTVLSFWQIWADLLNTFFESREKCAHLISASLNRPFPSSPGSLFQKKGRCSAFDMEIIFHFHANKTHFHKKGCAPSLILKVRIFGTRKWPILLYRRECLTGKYTTRKIHKN